MEEKKSFGKELRNAASRPDDSAWREIHPRARRADPFGLLDKNPPSRGTAR